VNVFFYCTVVSGDLSDDWADVGGSVVDRRFFTLSDLQNINAAPKWLKDGEWLDQPDVDIYRGQDKK
jgi:hypothetical protein